LILCCIPSENKPYRFQAKISLVKVCFLIVERRETTLDWINKRFPRRSEIIAVLSVAVFVCFSWTLYGFFDKLSSFVLYFTPAEIGNIFAFMMAFALLESLAVTVILTLISGILPSGWLREGFALKGFVILIILAVTSILFQKTLNLEFPSTLSLVGFLLVPLGLILALISLIHSKPKLKDFLINIQDRILIMLYVYIPLGLFALLVVLFKNLF